MSTRAEATLDDLHRVAENGKAELVNGEIVHMSPTGGVPGRAGGEIYVSLRDYERRTKRGYAFPDNVGFTVTLPHRQSFSPDAAFHSGPLHCLIHEASADHKDPTPDPLTYPNLVDTM